MYKCTEIVSDVSDEEGSHKEAGDGPVLVRDHRFATISSAIPTLM